jgi:hypothetical protein
MDVEKEFGLLSLGCIAEYIDLMKNAEMRYVQVLRKVF